MIQLHNHPTSYHRQFNNAVNSGSGTENTFLPHALKSHPLQIMSTLLGHGRPLPLGKGCAQPPQRVLSLQSACPVTVLPASH